MLAVTELLCGELPDGVSSLHLCTSLQSAMHSPLWLRDLLDFGFVSGTWLVRAITEYLNKFALKYESAPCPSEDRGRYAPHGYFSESASPPACPRSWYAGLLQSPPRWFKVLFLPSVSSSAPPSFVFLCRRLYFLFLVVFLSSHGVRESLRVPKTLQDRTRS